MTYRGHIENGKVILEDDAELPDGTQVEVMLTNGPADPARAGAEAAEQPDARPIEEIIAEIAAEVPDEEWNKLPPDLSDQLDHYVYGTPKH